MTPRCRLLFLFLQLLLGGKHESHAANGMNQWRRKIVVNLGAQITDVNVHHAGEPVKP